MRKYLVAGFAFLALLLGASVAVWKLGNLRSLTARERAAYLNPEGFVTDIFNRAQRVSWAVTFLLLIAVEAVVFDKDATGYWTTLPVVFYFQLLLGTMLGVMASVFLVLSRAAAADDAEDGVRA